MKYLMMALALSMTLAGPAVADDDTGGDIVAANQVINEAANELAAALRERRAELEADDQALYALIDSILDPRFDDRYAAQLVLGKHWRSADTAQKKRFIGAFYQTMLKRYAEGVLEFNEERMTVLPYRGGDEKRKRTTVKTTVVLDDGTEVPVNYGLVLRNNVWKVYDVTIEGISYVRNFRTELNAEVSAKGLDAVIQRLEDEAGIESAQAL